ncbi:MAG: polymer-forming cytoskeletal protein, partial [Zavarzinia sp.]|nr:polymer-forming cytoskeletal protein [Zavarzinia sp.]
AAPTATPPSSDDKKLIVGRNIVLSGQITACDKLVVEGRVDATLTDSRVIEITSSGVFKGAAEIDEALIGGVFEGKLICHGRLLIRATGKVKGEIRYGQLEIECGGELVGDINTVQGTSGKAKEAEPAPAPAPEPAPAAPAAVTFPVAPAEGGLI